MRSTGLVQEWKLRALLCSFEREHRGPKESVRDAGATLRQVFTKTRPGDGFCDGLCPQAESAQPSPRPPPPPARCTRSVSGRPRQVGQARGPRWAGRARLRPR